MKSKESRLFQLISVSGRGHVIVPNIRMLSAHPDASYRNTGQALCGVLYKGESLEKWMERTNKAL